MLEDTARTESERLISAAIDELGTSARNKSMNHFVAKHLGAVANLLGHREIVTRVQQLLDNLSLGDFFVAAITNIDWRTLNADDLARLRSLEPADTYGEDHPIYDRNVPVPDLVRFAESSTHLKLCLQGGIADALKVAKTDLDYEEIADTLAALGRYDEAIALIDSAPVPEERRLGVRFVVLAEKCRRLVPTFKDDIAAFGPKGFDRLAVILALAARRPWVGYPYPDY